MFDKFGIMATPTVLFLEPDGSEVDWIVGYGPPPEKYRDQVDDVLTGVDTFKALSERYAADPSDIEVVFKLGMKYDRRYDTEKASEFFKKVLEMDPAGTKGTTDFFNEKVSFTQYAESNLGMMALRSRPPDPGPLLAFIKKYSDGRMVRLAYDRLSASYFVRSASAEDATKFFEDYGARYPGDLQVIDSWLMRIIRDQGPYDLGDKLSQEALSLLADKPQPRILLDVAQFYLLKGDTPKAVELADRAVKNAGESGAAIVPSAATIYMKAGDTDRALAAYGPAYAKTNWDNTGALSRYATFWSGQGGSNTESALSAAKRVTELSPDSYTSWNTLSTVYRAQNNYAEALAAAEQALELAPEGRAREFIEKNIEAIKKQSVKK